MAEAAGRKRPQLTRSASVEAVRSVKEDPIQQRILIVDDEVRALDALRRMLPDSSVWDARFAHSADEAIAWLHREPFDVVVSDVSMPGTDGFELLARIQTDPRTSDIPVIMLTGLYDRDLKRRALDLGAVDLLNKPIQREELFARIRSGLLLRSYQQQLRSHNVQLERTVADRTRALEDSRLDVIWCLARAAEASDGITWHHALRVAAYSRTIAEALGLDRDFSELLMLASPLHDVGKIGIPDHVLNKPGALSDAERLIMERHCLIGAEILDPNAHSTKLFRVWARTRETPAAGSAQDEERVANPVLRMASAIALTHHERWDGHGYPNGVAGDAIPLESRIAALADVYDALRSSRPYKRAYPEREAIAIIARDVGAHFDPEVHAAFVRALPHLRSIYRALADDAEERPALAA